MKQIILSLLIVFISMLCNVANAQSVVFPTYKTPEQSNVDISPVFKPDAKFLRNNPDYLTKGKYVLESISREKSGDFKSQVLMSSDEYPAAICTNVPAISTNSRIVIFFSASPYNIGSAEKTREELQKEAMGADCGKRHDRELVYPQFAKSVTNYFDQVGFTNYYMPPKFGKYINEQTSLKPNDIVLEFSVDDIWCNFKNTTDPSYVKYSIAVKDITGRTITTVRQGCLMNVKTKYFTLEIMKCSIKPAVESMLNRYFTDAALQKDTRYYTNAQTIKSQSDKNYLSLINKKARLEYIQEDKTEILCELKVIQKQLKNYGVDNLDLSKIDFTFRTPNPQVNAIATSVASGAAVVGSAIAAAVIAAEITKLKKRLQAEMDKAKSLAQKEQEIKEEIENLLKQASQAPQVNYSNLSLGDSEPVGAASENFWDETEHKSKLVAKPKTPSSKPKPAPDSQSFFYELDAPQNNQPVKPTISSTKKQENKNFWSETNP